MNIKIRYFKNGTTAYRRKVEKFYNETMYDDCRDFELITDKEDRIVVFDDDYNIIGSIVGYKRIHYLFDHPVYFIHSFYVREKYRKLGIGRLIIEEIHKHIEWPIFTNNVAENVIEFYKKIGFEVMGHIRKYTIIKRKI